MRFGKCSVFTFFAKHTHILRREGNKRKRGRKALICYAGKLFPAIAVATVRDNQLQRESGSSQHLLEDNVYP